MKRVLVLWLIIVSIVSSCVTRRSNEIVSQEALVERERAKIVLTDTSYTHNTIHIVDSVHIKDSTVLTVDTVGRVIREYRYIREFVGRDTVDRYIYISASRDSSEIRDSINHKILKNTETTIVKNKIQIVVVIFVLSLIALFMLTIFFFLKFK